jgi:membrane associated rhomboid family serine protease
LHLIFSVAIKVVLGFVLERRIGAWRTALIYFLSGLAGAFASAIFVPEKSTVIGSAPVFGLAAALVRSVI